MRRDEIQSIVAAITPPRNTTFALEWLTPESSSYRLVAKNPTYTVMSRFLCAGCSTSGSIKDFASELFTRVRLSLEGQK